MKQICALPLALIMVAATPLHAEEPPSLMERGAQLFFECLMQEVTPALDDLAALIDKAGPALQSFVTQMGPKLQDVFEEVEDWSVYDAPEVLPNGDIIIRRKPDKLAPDRSEPDTKEQQPPTPQVDL